MTMGGTLGLATNNHSHPNQPLSPQPTTHTPINHSHPNHTHPNHTHTATTHTPTTNHRSRAQRSTSPGGAARCLRPPRSSPRAPRRSRSRRCTSYSIQLFRTRHSMACGHRAPRRGRRDDSRSRRSTSYSIHIYSTRQSVTQDARVCAGVRHSSIPFHSSPVHCIT